MTYHALAYKVKEMKERKKKSNFKDSWIRSSPIPVSALIHVATMVTVGVFMIARCSPLFEYPPTALKEQLWEEKKNHKKRTIFREGFHKKIPWF